MASLEYTTCLFWHLQDMCEVLHLHPSRRPADCWGTTVDFATSFLHSSRSSPFRYLDVIQCQQIRKTFTRFRLGIDKMLRHSRERGHVGEKGVIMLSRPLCNGEAENEEHLLAICGWYHHIGQQYLFERSDLDVFQYKSTHALTMHHSSSVSAISILYTLRLRDEQIILNRHSDLRL